MTVTKSFTPGLHLLCIAALLAALALMVAPSPMGQAAAANGQGPWVIVVLNSGGTDAQGHDIPGALYTVDSATGTLYGPFLQGQLGSAGGGLFDVAITPGCGIALVSNFVDSTVYLVDFSDPTNLRLIGSVNLGFFAEDIAITADGKFALVADGGFSARLASINMATGTLVEVQDLGGRYANAVAVAPDGTVIVVDYFGKKVHTLTVDSSGNLTLAQSYDLPMVIEHGEEIHLRPVNVAVAPDGRTVLVLATNSDHVPVYRITGPGTLEYMGLVEGLPAVWREDNRAWSGSQQSVAFNCKGTQAYVLTNGIFSSPNQLESSSKISVLEDRS